MTKQDVGWSLAAGILLAAIVLYVLGVVCIGGTP